MYLIDILFKGLYHNIFNTPKLCEVAFATVPVSDLI